MREFWVIEDSRKNAVFAPDKSQVLKGYIPREVGESIIGRKTTDGECVFFSREEIQRIKGHPEYRLTMNTHIEDEAAHDR